jgi:hypothetical protein
MSKARQMKLKRRWSRLALRQQFLRKNPRPGEAVWIGTFTIGRLMAATNLRHLLLKTDTGRIHVLRDFPPQLQAALSSGKNR